MVGKGRKNVTGIQLLEEVFDGFGHTLHPFLDGLACSTHAQGRHGLGDLLSECLKDLSDCLTGGGTI